MKATELSRLEVLNLYASMNAYIAKVGRKADRLAAMCHLIILHEANEMVIEAQNKAFGKLQKELERVAKRLTNNYAQVHSEGPLKGTFVLNEDKEFTFTPENQNKLDVETAELLDKNEENVSRLYKEKVTLYLDVVSELPENLPVEFRNSLEILIAA